MACRCKDIEAYHNDIDKLVNAEGYTQELIGYVNEVRDTLDELKTEYDNTLEATGEFLAEFANLDMGADVNANIIAAQISGAKRTLEVWLKEAEAEDMAWNGDHH